jgi:hypothetical protein
MSQTMKPRAENMTRGELVAEFRKLQGWYNTLRAASTELEGKYAKLEAAHQESVNLNLTMQTRVKNQEKLLLHEITSNNEKNQMLLKRIELLQVALYDAQKE